ncbi:MAG: hypothetical protein JWN48_2471 [Myxococcaceae bacterium]|nr:hypothetical protein [Myxococcaceae bacterium]
MKPTRALLTISVALSFSALACTEDVGPCDDPLQGKDTVLIGSQLQYGGQAIMNTSCANICHSSAARGKARNGAPEGLDFDVRPLDESSALSVQTNKDGNKVLELPPADVSGLRERQRKIFEKRNSIWQQVKDGMMPPDGKFDFTRLLDSIHDSNEKAPCSGAKRAFQDIESKPSQDVLRNWLSCNVPIIEVTGAAVSSVVAVGDADAGTDGIIAGLAGQAGYQYHSCSSTPSNGDGGLGGGDSGTPPAPSVVTIEQLNDPIFVGAACSACHPGLNPAGVKLDLSSVDKAYTTLVMDKAVKCNGKPYITPGDVSKSWFYDVVSLDDPGCKTERMPQLMPKLSAAKLKLISDWIAAGAKRDSDVKGLASPLVGGLDAGL